MHQWIGGKTSERVGEWVMGRGREGGKEEGRRGTTRGRKRKREGGEEGGGRGGGREGRREGGEEGGRGGGRGGRKEGRRRGGEYWDGEGKEAEEGGRGGERERGGGRREAGIERTNKAATWQAGLRGNWSTKQINSCSFEMLKVQLPAFGPQTSPWNSITITCEARACKLSPDSPSSSIWGWASGGPLLCSTPGCPCSPHSRGRSSLGERKSRKTVGWTIESRMNGCMVGGIEGWMDECPDICENEQADILRAKRWSKHSQTKGNKAARRKKRKSSD